MKHKLAVLSLVLLSALPSSLAAHSAFHSRSLSAVFSTYVPPVKRYQVGLSLPTPPEAFSSLLTGSVVSLITSKQAPLLWGALVAVGALAAVLIVYTKQQNDAAKIEKPASSAELTTTPVPALKELTAFADATPLATVAEQVEQAPAAEQVEQAPVSKITFREAVEKLEAFADATPLATVAELTVFAEATFQEAGVTLTPEEQVKATAFLTKVVASKNITPLASSVTPEDALNNLLAFANATPLATVAELITFAEAAFQEAGITLKAADKTSLAALLTQQKASFADEILPEEANLRRALQALVPTTDAAYQAAFTESVQRMKAYKRAFMELDAFQAAQQAIADTLPNETIPTADDEDLRLQTVLSESYERLATLDNLAALRGAIQSERMQASNAEIVYAESLEMLEIQLLCETFTFQVYKELALSLLNGFQGQKDLQQFASSLTILPGSQQAIFEQFKASLIVGDAKQEALRSLTALEKALNAQNATEITKQLSNMDTALAQLAAKVANAQTLANQLGAKTKLAMLEEAQAAMQEKKLRNDLSGQKLTYETNNVDLYKAELFINSQEAFKKLAQLKKFTASAQSLKVNEVAKTTEQLAKIQSASNDLAKLSLERTTGNLAAITDAFRNFTDSVTEVTS